MTDQIRRAATSVAANIAEGHGRESTRTFVHFLRISQSSLKELETHLVIAEQVGLLPPSKHQPLCQTADDLGRMLRSLIRSLEKKAKERE